MKTRRVTEPRQQLYTPDGGEPRLVTVPTPVDQIVAPRDWDATAFGGVMLVVLLLVIGAMVWSTVSIGTMLSHVAPSWAAYMIASIFDAAWIVCLVLEWLSRFDPVRAAVPRNVGWAALAVSMAAIATNGYLIGYLLIGLFGAVVSAIAKGLWAMVMHHTARPLSPVQQAWVDEEMSSLNATLNVTAARRKMARARSRIDAELAALALAAPVVTTVEQQLAAEPAPDPVEFHKTRKKVKRLQRELEELRKAPASSGVSAPAPVWSPAPPPISGAIPENMPMTQLVKTLLDAGTPRENVVEQVLRLRPAAIKDSVRRTLTTVLKESGYL